MRILCVDDEPCIRQMLQTMLSEHEVEGVGDAETALQRLDASHFDLAILDGRLPSMSGPSLAVRIRQRVAVLGFTGEHVAARQFLDLGVPVVLKPAAYVELEAGIAQAVGVAT